MKKKNNPFRYSAAYFALFFVFFLVPEIVIFNDNAKIEYSRMSSFVLPFYLSANVYSLNEFILYTILIPIIGFFAGYLIQRTIKEVGQK